MLRLATPAFNATPAIWMNAARSVHRSAVTSGLVARQQLASSSLYPAGRIAGLHSTRLVHLDTERQTSAAQHPPPPAESGSPLTKRRDASASRTSSSSSSPSTPSNLFQHTDSSRPPPPDPLAPPSPDARVPKRRITSVNELPKSFGRNQMIQIPERIQHDLEDVMSTFKAPIRYAFAYGSGVFQQKGYTNEVRALGEPFLAFCGRFDQLTPFYTHRTSLCSTLSLPCRIHHIGTRSICSRTPSTTRTRCDCSARTPSPGCRRKASAQRCGSTLTWKSTAR